MTLPYIILLSVAFLAALANIVAEYSRCLMMMQQNSYRTDRYMKWLRQSGDSTSYPRLAGLMVLFASLASFSSPVWGLILIALFAAGSAIVLFNRKYKKPLVRTPRVRRIFAAMGVLTAVAEAGIFFWAYYSNDSIGETLFYTVVGLQGFYCASHVVVMAAVKLLSPLERHINRRYYNEAAGILASIPGLKVVGITGSYGKTSTKHYLHRILSEHFETLMTPGSYNTTLGVIRTIREMMQPYCEVFICEMGAKQKGDIKEICDLVHPTVGIVTAVGPQHLESFGSLENVQATKFELVDSLGEGGLAVVNDDFPMIASRKVDNVECLRYGVGGTGAEFRAVNIEYSSRGTTFTITGPGVDMKFATRLVGECNVSNLIAAVITALRLGVPGKKIQAAVERIEPVEHRLSIKRTPAGVTILDDAFNSNPAGAKMALDVLAGMTGGRRIVVTPGMIELGAQRDELNRAFGRQIAASADIAVVVGEYNRQSIVDGIEEARPAPGAPRLIIVPSFVRAQQELSAILRSGDTVLYENDLPDTFK